LKRKKRYLWSLCLIPVIRSSRIAAFSGEDHWTYIFFFFLPHANIFTLKSNTTNMITIGQFYHDSPWDTDKKDGSTKQHGKSWDIYISEYNRLNLLEGKYKNHSTLY
jgi:hypothetical protein